MGRAVKLSKVAGTLRVPSAFQRLKLFLSTRLRTKTAGRTARGACLLLCAVLFASGALAAEPPGGACVIIGGALRRDNAPVFHRLVQAGGGAKQCRFVIFDSASNNSHGADRFAEALRDYGVTAAQIVILDIRPENAARSAFDPANVAAIRRATVAYFVGGDQERIPLALRRPDGGDTPALAALKELLARGGVIAGSSAGAAMQSETMIAAAGLRDAGLDEGMDTLDFGLTSDPSHRGLLVTAGLGFFHGGIVDQHFNQSRGRLGRLARAVVEKKIRFGFGIDENTAMIVGPGGAFEVVGTGCVTIVDAAGATCDDGPLGCRIGGLRLSCIQTGDRFDPKTCTVAANPAKELSAPGDEWKSNNHLITDINAAGAVPYALFSGLGGNTARRQIGIALRYSRSFGHGYRFTFRKLKSTRVWAGHVENVDGRAVQDVALDIEPILSTLQGPETALPSDLPAGPAARACQAVWFRGVLLADARRHFRPDAPLTRGDLATALAQAIHLDAPEHEVLLADVPESAAWHNDVAEVIAAKLMEADARGRFRPEAPVTRQEAAQILVRAWEFDHGRKSDERAVLMAHSSQLITRCEAAVALARLMGLR